MHPPAALTLRLDGPRAVALVLAGAAALAAVAGVGLMGPGVALYLAACLAAGAGLTHLSGLDLDLEERLAYGAVIGAMVVSALGFAAALLLGLGPVSVVLGALAGLGLSAPGWWRARAGLAGEASGLVRRWSTGSPWPLWALLAVAWPFTFAVLSRAYVASPAGLDVWAIGVYSDWAAHLTYAGSFAYGQNFPPQYPIDPGHRLGYPFMVDFFAASLVPLGASLTSALVETSGYLGLALPAVMCLAGARLVGSLGAAAAGVGIFALGGGLGFTALVGEVDHSGGAALQHLPRLFTQDAAQNLQWMNPVLAYLLPQRSILFGLPVALIVAAALWVAGEAGAGRRPYAAAGVLAGLSPLFHVHGYGTAVVLAGCWALIDRRRPWPAFFIPALAIGVPLVLWLVQPGAGMLRWQPGWLAAAGGHHDNWAWFWLKNAGLFVPLLLVAQFQRGRFALHFAPLWLWFLVPNLFVFQPWDWDNTKFLVFWYGFGALMVGALLVRLGRRSLEGAALAAVLAVLLGASGGLDVVRSLDMTQNRALFTDAGGVRVAAWVRSHTPARAVFAVAPAHNEPVPALGGRAVLAGYPGWLWTYGLPDWGTRVDQERAVLAGTADARALGVSYVVIGPLELAAGASPGFWQAHGEQVYSDAGYTVYRVR